MVVIRSLIRLDKLLLFLVVVYAIDISITFNYATESEYDPWLSIQGFEVTEELFSPGPLGYSIAVGTQRPGEYVEVHFYSLVQEGFDLNATVDFKLIKIDDGLVSVISEKSRDIERVPPYGIRWTVQLPEEAPARYSFGVVLRDEANETIGLLISTLKVPVQELNATMTLNKARFRVGEKPVLAIVNNGPTEIIFGMPYSIERAVAGEWVEVPLDRFWEAWAAILKPGETYRQTVDLPRLQPGEYRVSKTVSAEETYLSETLTAEFTIIRDVQTILFLIVVLTVIIVIGITQLRKDQRRKRRWCSLLTSLCVTMLLLFVVEVVGNVISSFFPWKQVGKFHFWRNPIANIVVFLPLLPAFIGSVMVEPAFPPLGVIGATIGSLLSPYFTESIFMYLGLRETDFYLILVAEHGPDTFFNYFLVGVVGGVLGWVLKSLEATRADQRRNQRLTEE